MKATSGPPRFVLSDAQWARMAPLTSDRTGHDNRVFVEAVLWIVRTDSPWRELPAAFGAWNSVFRRFSRWRRKGVWWHLFAAMSDDAEFGYRIVGATIVHARRHAAGRQCWGLAIGPNRCPDDRAA